MVTCDVWTFMQAELMAADRDYLPRRRQERERKPIPDTLGQLTGSQRENARRHLSGQLIQALSHVEKHWRPGWYDKSLLAPGGHTIGARLFGPGRAPIPEGDEPDFYTLRYKTRGAIIGAEGGMFVLKPHQLVLRDDAFELAVAHLRAEGLCCHFCAEEGVIYSEHTGLAMGRDGEPVRRRNGDLTEERCVLNELMQPADFSDLWVTHAEAVVKAAGVPSEYIQVALALFDRAVAYPLDEEPFVRRPSGRPKKDVR